MRLQPLNHLIEVVRAVAQPARILVLGSASLLPEHPELGIAGAPLELTTDADFLLEPVNEAIAESLQLAAGRDSAFMAQNGYYADVLRPAIAEALPAGWESRLHPVARYDNVFALDVYVLALVKLMVGRPKDLDLLRALLKQAHAIHAKNKDELGRKANLPAVGALASSRLSDFGHAVSPSRFLCSLHCTPSESLIFARILDDGLRGLHGLKRNPCWLVFIRVIREIRGSFRFGGGFAALCSFAAKHPPLNRKS